MSARGFDGGAGSDARPGEPFIEGGYTHTAVAASSTSTVDVMETNPDNGRNFTLTLDGNENYAQEGIDANGQNGAYAHGRDGFDEWSGSEWGTDGDGDFSIAIGGSFSAFSGPDGNDASGAMDLQTDRLDRYSELEMFWRGGDDETDVNGGVYTTASDGFPVQRVNPLYQPTGTREVAGDIWNKYCFPGDVQVSIAGGTIAIENMKAGEKVWAVPEGSPDGKPVLCTVEEVFKNPPAEIWEVHFAGGQVLRTTAGHLVYVKTMGWTTVKELRPGNLFRTEQGEGLRVEKVVNTQKMEPVYNLRVADCHTYFVSADETSPAVLVHNDSWWDDTMKAGSFFINNPGQIAGDVMNISGNLLTGNFKDAINISRAELTAAAASYSSTGGENQYKLAVKAQVQGALDVVNGVQDAAVGLANLPAMALNFDAWLVGINARIPYLISPDWAKGIVMDENGTYDATKFIGGNAATFLLTAGIGVYAEGATAAEEAVNTGTNVVYQSIDEAGNVKYIGITDDLERRAAEHLAQKGINIDAIDGLENLSRSDARAVEQVLIENFGLGKNGGTLINKINSIAQSNPIYQQAAQRGIEILRFVGFPGF